MPKALEAQRDFSAGEIDVSAKRSDQSAEIAPLLKAGVRQALNMRIRNSKALRNRPGRRALYLENARVDRVQMKPGILFDLCFTVTGILRIRSVTGAVVYDSGVGFPWRLATLAQVTWAKDGLAIYICFPGMQPEILAWDGVSTWTPNSWSFAVSGGGQRRSIFYRISKLGVLMGPSATTGNIIVNFSDAIAKPGMVGTLMRFCGRQMLITGFNSVLQLTASVIEPLPPAQTFAFGVSALGLFNIGDVVLGDTSGAKGVVVGVSAGGLNVQLLSTVTSVSTAASGASSKNEDRNGNPGPTTTTGFIDTEIVAGPGGSAKITGAPAVLAPIGVAVWDEEVMSTFRGWPASVFSDQGRLGFCNFASVPNGIAWSAIGAPADFYVGPQPSDAMFELAPDDVQIYYVVPGAESSEFVFGDKRVYYIPISVTNPLAPGRVAFNILSSSGSLPVLPRVVDEDIIYVDGPGTIMSITAPGMYYRPYGTRNLNEVSAHLIKSPVCIAIPTQTNTFAEQYIYVLNGDGSIAVGKYETENGQIKGFVGWTPWQGAVPNCQWISALNADVLFMANYAPNGIASATVVEILDDTLYLDAAMPVNAAPAGLAPPFGKGPLWWLANGSVDLMDQATRMMGTYQIDANGFIVPQNNGGENLAAASLVAGQYYELIVEPFLPAAPPGPDQHQRMTRRRIARLGVHVSRSTGFVFAKIASRIGPLLPAVGSLTFIRRVTTWNQDDDPTLAPVLRETAYNTRVTGRDYDPRVAIVKDTPGPIEILEIGFEAST